MFNGGQFNGYYPGMMANGTNQQGFYSVPIMPTAGYGVQSVSPYNNGFAVPYQMAGYSVQEINQQQIPYNSYFVGNGPCVVYSNQVPNGLYGPDQQCLPISGVLIMPCFYLAANNVVSVFNENVANNDFTGCSKEVPKANAVVENYAETVSEKPLAQEKPVVVKPLSVKSNEKRKSVAPAVVEQKEVGKHGGKKIDGPDWDLEIANFANSMNEGMVKQDEKQIKAVSKNISADDLLDSKTTDDLEDFSLNG